MSKSDLPFGSEFSPNQIDLPTVLDLLAEYSGDRDGFENIIKETFFKDNKTSERNKKKLAMNLRLSLKAYHIIDDALLFTDFGESLYQRRDVGAELYAELAKHILLYLNGLILVQCVQDMQVSGQQVTLVKLREWLQERGINFPRGGKHPSMMRLWLEKAGVFAKGWRVNEVRLMELAGITANELDALAQLTLEQKAFIKSLVNQGEQESYSSNEIEKLASAIYGVKFNEKMLPKTVLYPLRDAGYITLVRGTKSPGRGAKPFLVYPTEQLKREVVLPILEQLEQQVYSDLRPLLRKPLAKILDELNDTDTHIRDLALEALAFKFMRIIDLDYVATRLRGNMTGGAEVDLIFESDRLVFSRWQIQCKNTSSIRLDDVAKEVGLTHMLKSNVIVIVSTGKIGVTAREYANKVMADSNLAIVMIDRTDIEGIIKNPSFIIQVLNREAKHAMQLKKLDPQIEK
ncbi:MAG: restriction endonuclease [Anaerolineae bacterium]|nr:restriction endonuclease [Anaerolineae bacterium]